MRLSIITLLTLISGSKIDAFAPATSSLRSSTSTSLFAFIDVDERAQRNLGSFDDWAASNGIGKVPSFQITSEDGVDFSVITTQDLAAGQTILGVPAAMILSSSKAKAELEGAGNGGVKDAVDLLYRMGAGESVPHFYLFLKVLVEFLRRDQSVFFPWLDSMPRLFFNSVSMTDFCYECLPPYVFRLSRVERAKFDNFCEALQKVDIIPEKVKVDKDLCKWAFNVVHTRSVGEQGGEQSIVPMADMFNHGTDTEVLLNFDDDGNCQASTTRDVPAGSPLRLSYGCPTNPSYFFTRYGFLDQSSPGTFCKILDIQPTPELVDIGLDFSKMLFYKETGDISEQVWDVVLYAKVLTMKPDLKQRFYEAHMTGDIDSKRAIHGEYALETATELKNHVDMFLRTLDDLSAKAVGKDVQDHPRLPLIMNHNEFVKETFLAVKARLDPAVEQMASQRQSQMA